LWPGGGKNAGVLQGQMGHGQGKRYEGERRRKGNSIFWALLTATGKCAFLKGPAEEEERITRKEGPRIGV